MYERRQNQTLRQRLSEPRRFIQILLGPRQVGKTTSLRQVLAGLDLPSHYATADTPTLQSSAWLEEQWAEARRLRTQSDAPTVLAIDEVQKISDWSARVKRLWDEDTYHTRPIQVVLTGSSPLGMQRGLSESLAGRFETIAYTHWLFPECRDAFDWDLDTFMFYGGYPGAAPLISEPERWRSYVLDSIVETTVSRDVLLMTRIDKPALLRRVFDLACEYAGRELTFEKMVGALQDAGNTTTVAHYLDLLDASGLVVGLQKYAGDVARRRRSTPKLAVHNTALMTAVRGWDFAATHADPATWGRVVDAAVGAHLLAKVRLERSSLYYWRASVRGSSVEVDYVLDTGLSALGLEVKSGANPESLVGLEAFRTAFGGTVQTEIIGTGGTPLEEFFSR
jgi:hypothetical protein